MITNPFFYNSVAILDWISWKTYLKDKGFNEESSFSNYENIFFIRINYFGGNGIFFWHDLFPEKKLFQKFKEAKSSFKPSLLKWNLVHQNRSKIMSGFINCANVSFDIFREKQVPYSSILLNLWRKRRSSYPHY